MGRRIDAVFRCANVLNSDNSWDFDFSESQFSEQKCSSHEEKRSVSLDDSTLKFLKIRDEAFSTWESDEWGNNGENPAGTGPLREDYVGEGSGHFYRELKIDSKDGQKGHQSLFTDSSDEAERTTSGKNVRVSVPYTDERWVELKGGRIEGDGKIYCYRRVTIRQHGSPSTGQILSRHV